MVTSELFKVMQSDMKRLALVQWPLTSADTHTGVPVKGSGCSYLPSSGTSRMLELGEGTTRTHLGLLKCVFSLTKPHLCVWRMGVSEMKE